MLEMCIQITRQFKISTYFSVCVKHSETLAEVSIPEMNESIRPDVQPRLKDKVILRVLDGGVRCLLLWRE